MTHWQIITRALHRHGGGPLPRTAFDEDFESDTLASCAIQRAKERGMVEVSGARCDALWSLTRLGRDMCAGRVMSFATGRTRKAETEAERSRRLDRLVADADEAAHACARLTRLQLDVLVLSAKGFSGLEISKMLNLCRSSVTKHSRRMMTNIGCTRSIEAAVIAAKAGLV